MKPIEKPERGLGSLQGIRWLAAVGALVVAVSVYRLLESQWAGMPVAAQFLTLVAAALTVFAAGGVLRFRLRLPIAGSALQLLFSVLVPVLSWGAAYLDLVPTASGAAVFLAAMAALLSAFRRTLQRALGYNGALYPMAFGAFTLSLPMLEAFGETLASESWLFLGAAGGFGVLFYFGARHINRFFFHRDRRDGVERPIEALPFLALGALYVTAMSLLGLPSAYVAVPVFVLGASLAATGEEYYRALAQSRPDPLKAWPRRSVVLLAVGFALIAIGLPLSFLDASGRAPAVVFACTSVLLLRWSFRYGAPVAHVLGLTAAGVAYLFLPALFPQTLVRGLVAIARGIGLSDTLGIAAFAQLGLALFFVALFRKASPTVARCHAIVMAIQIAAAVGLALLSPSAASIVPPAAFGIAVLGVWVSQRPELLLAAHAAFGASILAWSGESVLGGEAMRALAMALLALAIASPWLERLERFFETAHLRRYLLWPEAVWAAAIVVHGIASFASGGSLQVLLASLVLLTVGHRSSDARILTAGLGAFSLGVHGELALRFEASRVALAGTTLALLAASHLVVRRRESAGAWKLPAELSILAHGGLGLGWLLAALAGGAVTIEPLIVGVLGLALLDSGLRTQTQTDAAVGLGLFVVYPCFHLWCLGWLESVPVALLWILGCLLGAKALASAFEISRLRFEELFSVWRAAALLTALLTTGIATLGLSSCSVLLSFLRKKPLPFGGLLLTAMHGLVWISESTATLFPLALLEAWTKEFPAAALLALGWLLLVDRTDEAERRRLMPWPIAFEAFVGLTFLAGCLPRGAFAPWAYPLLGATALAFAFRHGRSSLSRESTVHAWSLQLWLGLAALVGFGAGWITFGNGLTPYVLLGGGVAHYAFSGLARRHTRGRALARSSGIASQTLVLAGGLVALGRVALAPTPPVWVPVLPLFLASLFYLVSASREEDRVPPAALSASFLGFGLFAIAWTQGVGGEFYTLAPGFSLVALSLLLSREMGARLSRYAFTAGAGFIYATPVLALYHEITWAWQAVLLVLTVGFGAASFRLKSRPLLTVSTAALVIDLACFVIKVRDTEPLLLWVGGLVLGVALMAYAAHLEYRREGLAQQLRVFGRELAGWY